jgi:hypothetical protein
MLQTSYVAFNLALFLGVFPVLNSGENKNLTATRLTICSINVIHSINPYVLKLSIVW